MKSANFLEPSGPLQACNGTALQKTNKAANVQWQEVKFTKIEEPNDRTSLEWEHLIIVKDSHFESNVSEEMSNTGLCS